MQINYIEPLSEAINKMKTSLFNPFDLSKWLIFGFTSFLASLGEGPGGNFSHSYNSDSFSDSHLWSGSLEAWDWLNANPFWFFIISVGVILLLAFIITLIWLSARGSFMFLDNVITDSPQVSKPWNEFKIEGNSLFIWRLLMGFGFLFIILIFSLLTIGLVYGFTDGDFSVLVSFVSILLLGFPFLLIIIAFAYISMFTNNFIVPIMYKDKISIMPAWKKFLTLFNQNSGGFILYGLLLFALFIAVGICVVLIGLLTCCIGFIFLIIPYIGAVILLPVSYTFRAYSLEFLAQFGEEYNLLKKNTEIDETLS